MEMMFQQNVVVVDFTPELMQARSRRGNLILSMKHPTLVEIKDGSLYFEGFAKVKEEPRYTKQKLRIEI